MTPEENKRRSLDPNVNYIKRNICDCDGDKSYVFISYKSDDWEVVLHEIVYKLVKDYGLNVYFDGSFDSHNSLWINQFPENMGDYKCKGVIAFFDDKYATSYATLMELLYSQTKKAAIGKSDPNGLPIVSIDLSRLTNVTGVQGQRDTGLGINTYEDGSVNVNAANELALFSKSFKELVMRNILVDAQFLWDDGDRLNAMTCSQIVREIKAYKKINENYYSSGMSLEGIVGSIRNACGTEVFSQITPPGKRLVIKFESDDKKWSESIIEGSLIKEPDLDSKEGRKFLGWFVEGTDKEWNFSVDAVTKDISLIAKWEEIYVDTKGMISLKSFLKNYDNSKFKKNTFEEFRLVGQGDASRYNTEFHKSAYDLVWQFVMSLLEERGKPYIDEVNRIHANQKNPVFITKDIYNNRDDQNKYRQVSVAGLEDFYMYRHYGQYDWIGTVLKQRLVEFGLSIADFSFEYIATDGVVIENTNGNNIGSPNEEKKALKDVFEYELWGISHKANSLADMMHDVFDLIAEKYVSCISKMADNDSITLVARKSDVDAAKLPSNKLNYFKAKKEHVVDGITYYVSTRYNREQGIGQLEKMLVLCEGNSEAFVITAEPDKIKKTVNSKKGIGELI